MPEHVAQVFGDRLDRLMVGRDAVPDQAIWRGQPVQHVDPDRPGRIKCRSLLDERLGGVEAGRAGADHGDLKSLHACDSALSPRVARPGTLQAAVASLAWSYRGPA